MLRPDRSIERVYLHRAPVDMRKQIDGLVILAKDVIQQDPMNGTIFAFINARRNKLKLLVWERNGFSKPSTQDPRCGLRAKTTLLSMAPLVWS